MAAVGQARPRCPDTGLTIPECSCRRCLERILYDHRSALAAEQIVIRRPADEQPGATEHREAA